MLSAKELVRFEKHIDLPDFGEEKQSLLASKKIAMIGAGGLGCPASLYLVASGVGKLDIYDDDVVMMTNLQRQVLYTESDSKKPKVEAAQVALEKTNPYCKINSIQEKISEDNIHLIQGVDLVVDATDNFKARYLLNRYCYTNNIPLVTGSVLHYVGQVMLFHSQRNNDVKCGCYKCLYPIQPENNEVPTCNDSAVFSPITGTIGTLMATEALKELLGIGDNLHGHILLYNSLSMSFSKMSVPQNHQCEVCSL